VYDCFNSAMNSIPPSFSQSDFQTLCSPPPISLGQLKNIIPSFESSNVLKETGGNNNHEDRNFTMKRKWVHISVVTVLKEFAAIAIGLGTWRTRSELKVSSSQLFRVVTNVLYFIT
jgi:hypothetical protein